MTFSKNKLPKGIILKKVVDGEVCSFWWEKSEEFVHLVCGGDVSHKTKVIFDFPVVFLDFGSYSIDEELLRPVSFIGEVFEFTKVEVLELLR